MSGGQERGLRVRTTLVYAGVLVFALAIMFRLFSIQLVEGEKWLARADHVATAYRTVQPDRGHVYSADGRLLATSIPEYEVRMDMRADGLSDQLFRENIDSLCWHLSRLFGDRSAAAYKVDLLDARARNDRYHRIKSKVDHERIQELRRFPLFRLGRFKSGLVIEKRTVRVHPFERLAARSLGYVLRDSSAIGLEGGFNETLRGVTGRRLERRLSGGVYMPVDDGSGREPVVGSDIHTTIDINLQDVADAALEAQLVKHGARYGCVVVMEVATGYVKAISNLSRRNDSTYVEDLNYAVGTATEPGSTYKVAALMVGMEDGLIRITDSVDTEKGKKKFYDRIMSDSHEGGFGRITVGRALEVSSNVGISKVVQKAYGSDPEKFVNGLRALGLDKPVGVRIPGEAIPVLHGPADKEWSGVSLPWMSIGYGVTLTPLQTLTFYNAIANDGRCMQPQLVSRITRGGREIETCEPVVLKERICSKGTLEDIRHLLEGVVDSGTATNLKSAHFKIAGKTGTAQIAQNNAGYKSKGVSYQASFVGYFPADAPMYSCIVVVNGPTSSVYYGNMVAGPIFTSIADKIYSNRLEMQSAPALANTAKKLAPYTYNGHFAELNKVLTDLDVPHAVEGEGEWVVTSAGDSVVTMLPRAIPGDALRLVPNVLGMGLKDALYLLETSGLTVQVVGRGMVRKQSILPGQRFNRGTRILIELTT